LESAKVGEVEAHVNVSCTNGGGKLAPSHFHPLAH
jgi:hypothetical protein